MPNYFLSTISANSQINELLKAVYKKLIKYKPYIRIVT